MTSPASHSPRPVPGRTSVGEAWVVGAVRTPIGRLGGALSGVRPDDLAATAIAALVERSGVVGADVEDVVLGCANQAGEDNRDVARMAGLLAGLPQEVGGTTVNRLCGSGLDAVSVAARARSRRPPRPCNGPVCAWTTSG